MRHLALVLATLSLLLPATASATWSIIAIDLATGRVVISSSTCAANGADQLKLLQAIVLPGVGVAAAQADVDETHANQKLVFEQMRMGTDPAEIIGMLEGDPRIASRQFGIIDLQGRTAGYSGESNGNFSRDFQGTSDDGTIVYSVQGNIILTEEALIDADQVMQEDTSGLLDRVMLAMETANSLGGDSRCSCEQGAGGAIPGLPCTNRTTSVSYILAADPPDARGSYAENHPQIPGSNGPTDLRAPWNDGDYFLYIAAYPGNFGPNEDASPICTLRLRYNDWNAQGRPRMNRAAPAPTPPQMQSPPATDEAGPSGRGGRGGGRDGAVAPAGDPAPPPATTEACARSASALPTG